MRKPRPLSLVRRPLPARMWAAVAGLCALGMAAGASANVIRVAASAVGTGGNSCSLVDAINAANSNTKTGACPAGDDKTNGGDVILLSAGTYKIATADNDWYGPTGLPAITSKITIVGDPQGSTIMRSPNTGVSAFRIFYIGGGQSLSAYNPPQDGNGSVVFASLPGPGNLTLINLTLENGVAQGGAGGSSVLGGGGGGLGAGGAIYNQGTLNLQGVTFVGNQAIGGAGGATNSTNNGDPGGGGGMAGGGDSFGNGGGFGTNGAWPDNTTPQGEFGNGGVSGQAGGAGGGGGSGAVGGFGGGGGGGGIGAAGGFGGGGGGLSPGGFGGGFFSGGGAGMGGAIFNDGGSVTLLNCTLTANNAVGGAGGLLQAQGLGGAIFNLNGTLSVSFSTLAGNTMTGGSVSGGAVYNLLLTSPKPGSPAADAGSSAAAGLNSSILYDSLQLTTDSSGNTTSAAATDCFNNSGSLSGGHDVLGATSASCILASDQFTDPTLLPLAKNGGPTETLAIIIGSALNTGDPSGAPLLDQRGYLRDALPDAGAYELSGTLISPPVITGLQNANLFAGGSAANEAFNVSGNDVREPALTLAVISSDTSVLPNASFKLSTNCGASLALDACSLSITPTAKNIGSVVVTVSATSGYGLTGYGSATLSVIPPPPVAKDAAVSVASGQTLNATLTATEALSVPLTYSIVKTSAHGKLTLSSASNSAFSYVPDTGFIGTDSFTWKVSTGSSDSNVATVTITVTTPPPPPGAPTVSDMSLTATENTPLNGTLQAVGNALSFAIATQPSHGKVQITNTSSGAFTYTPSNGFTGSDSFTFTAKSTLVNISSNPATVTITVSASGGGSSSGGGSGGGSGGPGSATPIASPATLTTYAGTPLNGMLAASDAAGNAVSFAVVQPSHGTVKLNNAATGAFTYSPAAGFTGSDSFSFSVTDSVNKLTSAPATVTVSISAIPVSSSAAPVAGGASFTTFVNTPINGNLSSSDAAGNPVSYTRVQAPAHGTVNITGSSGAFNYTPTTGYTGSDSFTFAATDSLNDTPSSAATVSLSVIALPPAAPANPVASGGNYTTYENAALTGSLSASDSAGNALSYAPGTAPAHGVLNITAATGAFTYTPTAGYIGSDSFTYTATDVSTTLASALATVTLTVSALPPPAPVAGALSIATYQDQVASGTLPSSDGAANAVTYAASTLPANGVLSVTAATGAFTYTPTAAYVGADSFAFTVKDSVTNIVSAPSTVPVSVDPVPGSDPSTALPLVDNLTLTVYENKAVSGKLSAVSAGGNALTYATVSPPSHGVLNLTTGTGAYTYTPTSTYTGPDLFTFTAKDNGTSVVSATATATITVGAAPPPATPPEVDDLSFTLYQDQALAGTLTAADAAGNAVNFAVVQPGHGSVTVTAATGAFVYTPSAGYTGSDSFGFTAIDTLTGSASGSATVSLTVSPVPLMGVAPIADAASLTVYAGQPLKSQLAALAVSGDALSYAIKTKPAHGNVKVTAATGAFTYSPAAGFTGKDSFSFTATDTVTHLMSAPATVSLTSVSPPLQSVPPLANGLSISVYTGQTFSSAVSAVDVNGNPVGFAVTTKPQHGSLTLDANTGSYDYTPAAAYLGSDSFAYTATDTVSKLGSSAATVEVTVVATPPTAVHHGGPSLGGGSYGPFSLLLLLALWLGRRARTVLVAAGLLLLPLATFADDTVPLVPPLPLMADPWYVGGEVGLIKPDSSRDAAARGLKDWGILAGKDFGDFALEFNGAYHADTPRDLNGGLANWKTYGADGLWYFDHRKSELFSPFVFTGLGLAQQYRGDDSKLRSTYLNLGAGFNSTPSRALPLRLRADLTLQHVFSGYNDLVLSFGAEFTFGGTLPPPPPLAVPDGANSRQYPMAWCTAKGGTPYETASGWACDLGTGSDEPLCTPAAGTSAAPVAATTGQAQAACPAPAGTPPPR